MTPGAAARPGRLGRCGAWCSPGFANAHSHAFHRALRGRTHADGGSFWTWREQMYALAAGSTRTTIYALARAVYAEMALAGITCVGEFHYLHHGPDGRRRTTTRTPWARRCARRRRDAGIRLTLLDTCYLTGGDRRAAVRARSCASATATPSAWAERVARADRRRDVAGWARPCTRCARCRPSDLGRRWWRPAPDASAARAPVGAARRERRRAWRRTAARRPSCSTRHGVLGPRTTAVHATHLTDEDIAPARRRAGTATCFCPTTERDLADGIGPARRLADAGSPLCLGSDQHAVIDLFEEARGLEAHERLSSRQRGHFTADRAAGGRRPGRATPRSAGPRPGGSRSARRPTWSRSPRTRSAPRGATRPDRLQRHGRRCHGRRGRRARRSSRAGEHLGLGPVGPMLADVIDALWREVVSR